MIHSIWFKKQSKLHRLGEGAQIVFSVLVHPKFILNLNVTIL